MFKSGKKEKMFYFSMNFNMLQLQYFSVIFCQDIVGETWH